jgi:hypothetical protein
LKLRIRYLEPRTAILLEEIGEECQRVLKLLAQLELPGLQEEQVDQLLGEPSAAILHLHEHTRGLDVQLDQEGAGTEPA